ncbi:TetR/AcrR family transcriptional regulator [Sphaerisporangium sp. TRM90804]|uniref:TetR/AcrR family transcriptional regulator n=1 Tax=Sphaerisporangium sp. TRM90804 TaxID=3031113 RepID=UPI002446CD2A|nr:TetR/AcrR family transcriptional regulator [Sphaerisporangium sp. TRM90804]MDH2426613.1 TetR/AcrR family transcriptional regulator [Sphaerisporangium sp. TRM90804]
MAQTAGGPRARYREQTRGEIKEIALRQLAEGGIGAIALTRIAKDLGLSGPALYRYFASRDDLLSALILDAYDDIATILRAAAGRSAARPARERLRELAGAYRTWAVTQPHRYLLLFGSPLPGYAAPPDTVTSARAALGPFVRIFAEGKPAPAVQSLVEQMRAWAAREPQVAAWVAEHTTPTGDDTAGVALAGALQAWTRLHGVLTLEVEGQFAGMGHDPATLMETELHTLADTFSLT